MESKSVTIFPPDYKVLDINEFTKNVTVDKDNWEVFGDGIFDTVMETMTKHLVAQYEANRIRQEDYANAYIDLLKVTLQSVLDAWSKRDLVYAQIKLTEAQAEQAKAQTDLIKEQLKIPPIEIKLKEAQIKLLEKQLESEDAKKALHLRQIEGFDESFIEKILKCYMDAWGIGFSVAKDSFDANGIPAPMQKAAIDDLVNKYVTPALDNYKYPRPGAVS